MKRTQIYLPEPIIDKIDQIATERGIKFPDVVRKIIDEWFEEKESKRRDG